MYRFSEWKDVHCSGHGEAKVLHYLADVDLMNTDLLLQWTWNRRNTTVPVSKEVLLISWNFSVAYKYCTKKVDQDVESGLERKKHGSPTAQMHISLLTYHSSIFFTCFYQHIHLLVPNQPINHSFFYSALNLWYHPTILLHLPFITQLTPSFISNNHLSIHQSICQPCTCYLPSFTHPSQGGGRLAAWWHTGEFRLAALHSLLLHLHCGCLWGNQDRECRHLVVRGIRVELAEVSALIGHANVGQCDANQPLREEHHLETVVLQGWNWAKTKKRVGEGRGWRGSETAWVGIVEDTEKRTVKRWERKGGVMKMTWNKNMELVWNSRTRWWVMSSIVSKQI